MNQYDQHVPAENNPYVAPPPIGYPSMDGNDQGNAPLETTTRGDDGRENCLCCLKMLKGCCDILLCCVS